MDFSLFGFRITITKNSVNYYDPATWRKHEQRAALRRAAKFAGYIDRIKEVRKYSYERFGDMCGLKNAKDFIDNHGGKEALHF